MWEFSRTNFLYTDHYKFGSTVTWVKCGKTRRFLFYLIICRIFFIVSVVVEGQKSFKSINQYLMVVAYARIEAEFYLFLFIFVQIIGDFPGVARESYFKRTDGLHLK